VKINSLMHHFNSFIIPCNLGAQYLIKIYVSKGEFFMFQNDLDMDMFQDEIRSCFRDWFIVWSLTLSSFNGLCFEWVSLVKLCFNGLYFEWVFVVKLSFNGLCFNGLSLWENIGFYNWVFQLQRTFATHGIYTTLSANIQIATIATNTLCCIQYHIYGAIHI